MTLFLNAKNQIKKDKSILICGFPMDITCSFRPGVRFAPQSIRENSYSIESYSFYQKKSLDDFDFYDIGDIELPYGDTSLTLDIIYKTVKDNLNNFLFSLGGEHLITFPIIKALREKYNNRKIMVVDFDAHTDLRDEYLKVKLSHSTVMRRILELGNIEIVGIGIRSGTSEEFDLIKNKKLSYRIENKPISISEDALLYITIDMDVFDPSCVSGVSNPEPGGINFKEFLDIIFSFDFKNLIGIDLVELNPVYDISNNSSIFASLLVRELLIKIFYEKNWNI